MKLTLPSLKMIASLLITGLLIHPVTLRAEPASSGWGVPGRISHTSLIPLAPFSPRFQGEKGEILPLSASERGLGGEVLPHLSVLEGWDTGDEASSPPRLFVSTLTQDPVTPTEAMRVANQNYEAGQYAEASAIYEVIIESGLHHNSVYYNLGNAYFKQGDLGRAILNYRRAQRLDPRDADIAANLSIARAQTVDQLEAPAEGGLADLVKITEEWLTLREATLLALTLWLLIGFLAVLALLKPAWRRWSGIGIGVLALFLVIGLISIANRSYTEQNYPPAVVVAQEVNVTSGPGTSEQYLVEFTLHAGTEVSLIESRSNWGRISLPGDLQGWIPAEAVERVSE